MSPPCGGHHDGRVCASMSPRRADAPVAGQELTWFPDGVFTLSVAASLLVGGGVASAAAPHTTSVKACVDHAGSLSLLVKGNVRLALTF